MSKSELNKEQEDEKNTAAMMQQNRQLCINPTDFKVQQSPADSAPRQELLIGHNLS